MNRRRRLHVKRLAVFDARVAAVSGMLNRDTRRVRRLLVHAKGLDSELRRLSSVR